LSPRSIAPGTTSIWLFPQAGSSAPSVFGPGDGEVYFAQRDQYEFQFQLRSVANPDDPIFTIHSDWTLPTAPFSTLPRTAAWLGAPTRTGPNRDASGPQIQFKVIHRLDYRDDPGDLSDLQSGFLDYRLIVRRTVQETVAAFPVSGPATPTEVLTQQVIINPLLSGADAHPPTVTFAFTDFDVAPSDTVADAGPGPGGFYSYDLQIEQIRRPGGGEFREVSRGPVQPLKTVPIDTFTTVWSREV